MLLLLELFKFFIAWAKFNHCDMTFLKMERHYNGFSYKSNKPPVTINVNTLTNFMSLVSFNSPWKHQETSGFEGAEKETTGIEPICGKDYINDVKRLHSLWAAKFNKNNLKNWQDL